MTDTRPPAPDATALFDAADTLTQGGHIDPIELLHLIRTADRTGLTGFADRLANHMPHAIRHHKEPTR